MTRILRTLALPTALAATVALSACGTGSSPDGHDRSDMSGTTTAAPTASGSATSAAGTKNAADVAFATGMILHHAQAIAMADMALTQATSAKVMALAPKIKAAQGPEIARMSGWLVGWGAPVPDTTGGHDMSAMGGQGDEMMSAQEMTDLGMATGSTFDRMWLQLMVQHHEGAVAMARTELAQGANPEGKELAQSIIDSQTVEIAEMSSILTEIPGQS